MADWTAVERCRKPAGWGKRHILALLGFCGFALSYAMRFSLSIAIVAMVNHTALIARHSDNGLLPLSRTQGKTILFKSDVCPHDRTPHETIDLNLNLFHMQNTVVNKEIDRSQNASFLTFDEASEAFAFQGRKEPNQILTIEEEYGEFDWSEAEQGIILGSFFWGYFMTQILGGWLSQRIGGKIPFGIGLLITALFSLVTPAAARYGGMSWVIFVRIGQGLAGGVTVPSMQLIIARWFPPEERGRLGSFAFAGMPFGTCLSMLCSGLLIHYFGWPSVFYSTGALAVVWYFLWNYFTHASPFDDPTIDTAELHYIQTALHGHSGRPQGCQQGKEKLNVPWSRVLLSLPFWAILVCDTCETWNLYTIMTMLPTYMSTVLHFDIKQNSVMSAFPHLLTLIVSLILTNVGDKLIERHYLSIGAVRKLCTSIALWGSAAALIGVAYSGCDRVKTVSLIGFAVAALGGKYGGFLVNIIDIAPNYAGILMGIINTLAALPGFFAPWVAGMLTNADPSLENWRLVFLITAAISFCGNLVFILFASGEEQSWNRGCDDNEEKTTCSAGANTIGSLKPINHSILSKNGTLKDVQGNDNGIFIILPNPVGDNQQLPLQVILNAQEESQEEKNGLARFSLTGF